MMVSLEIIASCDMNVCLYSKLYDKMKDCE